MDRVKVFGTHQEIRIDEELPLIVTDHTQAMIHKMTSMQMEAAICNMVMMGTLTDMADKLNKTGKGLLADRADLAADGVSHLAMMGWQGHMNMRRRRTDHEEATDIPAVARDLWNGDEGNDNAAMH